MKQVLLFLSITLLLFGCTVEEGRDSNISIEELYNGKWLDIGVVGSAELPDVGNVKYEYVELNEVSNSDRVFDALLITPEAFEEADQNKYIDFYNSVDYPVFFFGIEDFQMFAFINENMTIENSSYGDDAAYVQGFKNINGKKEGMQLVKSNTSDSDELMLVRTFNFINDKF
ncbi:MAG TPA: hypothetical protein VNR61_18695 [Niallia sp.]|nr:hypothetical protein [Niallia sp.]